MASFYLEDIEQTGRADTDGLPGLNGYFMSLVQDQVFIWDKNEKRYNCESEAFNKYKSLAREHDNLANYISVLTQQFGSEEVRIVLEDNECSFEEQPEVCTAALKEAFDGR